jgi:hypothetical protein
LKKNKNKKNKIINPPFAFCALHTESSLIASCTHQSLGFCYLFVYFLGFPFRFYFYFYSKIK